MEAQAEDYSAERVQLLIETIRPIATILSAVSHYALNIAKASNGRLRRYCAPTITAFERRDI